MRAKQGRPLTGEAAHAICCSLHQQGIPHPPAQAASSRAVHRKQVLSCPPDNPEMVAALAPILVASHRISEQPCAREERQQCDDVAPESGSSCMVIVASWPASGSRSSPASCWAAAMMRAS